jgi:hypothetical protein
VDSEQPSFTDVEYGNRRRVSRREQFLETMDATIPWATWVGLIEPHYYSDRPGKTGRKAKPVATMLRMYLLQVWFNLSDEGVEDAIYDSYAMRRFMDLDLAIEQVALKTMSDHDRAIESRKAAVRAKVEHPFLIVKRDFAFTKTRYRGIAKNLNHLQMLFASANWLMRARAVALTQATA